MVPRPGGKYSCSSENREYSGSEPSSRSQLATLGPRPIWLAAYASPPGTGQAEHVADLLLVDDGGVEPFPVAREVPADGVRHGAEGASERCRITGVAPAPAARMTILASIVPLPPVHPVILSSITL